MLDMSNFDVEAIGSSSSGVSFVPSSVLSGTEVASGAGVVSPSDMEAEAFLEASEAAFSASSACSFASRALILLCGLR